MPNDIIGTIAFSAPHSERRPYNMRHIQHHAAQLILRLRLDTDVDIPWIGAGWRDPAPIKSA